MVLKNNKSLIFFLNRILGNNLIGLFNGILYALILLVVLERLKETSEQSTAVKFHLNRTLSKNCGYYFKKKSYFGSTNQKTVCQTK